MKKKTTAHEGKIVAGLEEIVALAKDGNIVEVAVAWTNGDKIGTAFGGKTVSSRLLGAVTLLQFKIAKDIESDPE